MHSTPLLVPFLHSWRTELIHALLLCRCAPVGRGRKSRHRVGASSTVGDSTRYRIAVAARTADFVAGQCAHSAQRKRYDRNVNTGQTSKSSQKYSPTCPRPAYQKRQSVRQCHRRQWTLLSVCASTISSLRDNRSGTQNTPSVPTLVRAKTIIHYNTFQMHTRRTDRR